MQKIFIDNRTTIGVVSISEQKLLVEALQTQAKNDFNTSPWVEHGYCNPIEVLPWTEKIAPPVGSWNLIILDKLPEGNEEALGYHEDIEGGKIPVSYVGVKEARESDTPLSEVASHELIEMAVNPHVENSNEMRIVKHEGREYVAEPCDPVESNGYRNYSGLVANFCWPKYYGLEQTRSRLTQIPIPIEPFQVLEYGYISSRPIGADEEAWEETFGEKRIELPKWASRVNKIHGAK